MANVYHHAEIHDDALDRIRGVKDDREHESKEKSDFGETELFS